MSFLKLFHNHSNNSDAKLVKTSRAKISNSNIIDGHFKVFDFDKDLKTLNDVFKSTQAQVSLDQKHAREDKQFYNEARTGYTNPITHTLNVHLDN